MNELPVPLDILDGPDEELDVDEGIDPDELAEILEDANEDVARQVHEAEVETIGEEFPEEEVQESDEEEVGEGQCDLAHDEESLGVPSLQSEVEELTEEPRRSGRSTSAPERYNPASGHSYLHAAKGLLKKPKPDSKPESDNPQTTKLVPLLKKSRSGKPGVKWGGVDIESKCERSLRALRKNEGNPKS